MAPQIAAKVTRALEAGALRVHKGRVTHAQQDSRSATLEIKLRRGGAHAVKAQRVINCAGFEQDYRRMTDPFIRALFQKQWLTASDLGVGIKTRNDGAAVNANGSASAWLYAIGPMRIGTLLETTAVPEIREQAEEFAAMLEARQADGLSKFAESGYRG